MTNGRTLSFSIFAAALLALCLPAVAAAQWDRYPDYGRDRDRDDRRYGRHDDRYLRDSIQRLDRLSKNFESALDRELDRSHEDGSRHEDRVNNEVHDFRRAVGDLKSRFGNGRDLNRSRNEAQRVLQTAREAERASRHHFRNGRLANQWSQIRQELDVIAQAYGSDGYNDDYYRNGRNDRNDRNRRSNNNDWWRRLPIPY
ncbi:MAG: hypothetical protein H0V18_05600 [Pyrinomonadaceae bacterium]|nr:hypothetical protein [Pyrinomonadaceae bacterium]